MWPELGLPHEINDLICFHHEPEAADFGGDLINTVPAANHLCHLWIASNENTTAASSDMLNAIRVDFSPDEILEFQTQTLADVSVICEAYTR